MMKNGFIALNGARWADMQVDTYNDFTREIERKAKFYRDVGYTEKIIDKKLEWLYNARNQYYKIASGMI